MAGKRATLVELREFCNKVRNAGGANPLDAILPAVPEEADKCLVARNLNFSCEVDGLSYKEEEKLKGRVKKKLNLYRNKPWGMRVGTKQLADKIAESIESQVIEAYSDSGRKVGGYVVPLPAKIGNVAVAFDSTLNEVEQYALGESYDKELLDKELIPFIDYGNASYLVAELEDSLKNYDSAEEADAAVPAEIKQMLGERYTELYGSVKALYDESGSGE